MKKELPILFSTEMVQAILDGRKIMTRRIVKAHHVLYCLDVNNFIPAYFAGGEGDWCPYGQPGNLLWVREEHYRYGQWIEKEGVFTKTGRQKWQFIPHFDEIKFSDNPPMEFRKGMHHKDPHHVGWYKRLARFMPKAAARTWLEVTDIKVERLHDITGYDVLQEGIGRPLPFARSMTQAKMDYESREPGLKKEFEELWQKINGPESWKANSWVWVVSFQVLSTTGKPELKIAQSSVRPAG
jgi:hypothetical protein